MLLATLWAVAALIGALAVREFVFGTKNRVTVFEHSHALVIGLALVVTAVLIAGWFSLFRRRKRSSEGVGVDSVAAGAALVVVSVLGWLPGIATVGVVGALVVLSGLWPAHRATR
jgi:hypothetical protein